MISKNEVKYIQTLYHKKTRDEEGLFIAEGPKLVNELIEAGFDIRKLYALPAWVEQHKEIKEATSITETELNRISALQTSNQIVAILAKPVVNGEPVAEGRLSLVLDAIQDPGNLGTIIRIADWFGIYQVIAGEGTADVYGPKVVQATMGSIARVKVWYKNLDEWLAKATVPVYGALLNGEDINKTGKIRQGLLVIGNEGRGIANNLLPFIQHRLAIPAKGGAESLNAAVATGIILSHLVE